MTFDFLVDTKPMLQDIENNPWFLKHFLGKEIYLADVRIKRGLRNADNEDLYATPAFPAFPNTTAFLTWFTEKYRFVGGKIAIHAIKGSSVLRLPERIGIYYATRQCFHLPLSSVLDYDGEIVPVGTVKNIPKSKVKIVNKTNDVAFVLAFDVKPGG